MHPGVTTPGSNQQEWTGPIPRTVDARQGKTRRQRLERGTSKQRASKVHPLTVVSERNTRRASLADGTLVEPNTIMGDKSNYREGERKRMEGLGITGREGKDRHMNGTEGKEIDHREEFTWRLPLVARTVGSTSGCKWMKWLTSSLSSWKKKRQGPQ